MMVCIGLYEDFEESKTMRPHNDIHDEMFARPSSAHTHTHERVINVRHRRMPRWVVVGVMVTWRARQQSGRFDSRGKKKGRAAHNTQKKWLHGLYSSPSWSLAI